MGKHTPGPWRWEVNLKHHRVELCGGVPQFDKTVMAFTRWGMRNAAPEFIHDDGDYPKLTRCDDLVEVVAGREHHKDWFQTINNPDARLISLAPEMAEALREMCDAADALSVRGGVLVGIDRVIARTRDARAILAKLEAE